ncbi:hypothetical protein M8J76_011894 [Diaphorina citri]|nr:hypothetical protein M8J76_011894 [Diaphorina citri]
METRTECPGPDTMVTTEDDDDVSDKIIVSDDLKILEMTTPELELGKDPPELDYDGSVRVCVPDALEQPVVYGPLFNTTDFFGYLYFIFLGLCLLFAIVFPGGRRYRENQSVRSDWLNCKTSISKFKNFRFPKKVTNVNVKRGKISWFDAKFGSVYLFIPI